MIRPNPTGKKQVRLVLGAVIEEKSSPKKVF